MCCTHHSFDRLKTTSLCHKAGPCGLTTDTLDRLAGVLGLRVVPPGGYG